MPRQLVSNNAQTLIPVVVWRALHRSDNDECYCYCYTEHCKKEKGMGEKAKWRRYHACTAPFCWHAHDKSAAVQSNKQFGSMNLSDRAAPRPTDRARTSPSRQQEARRSEHGGRHNTSWRLARGASFFFQKGKLRSIF